MADIPLPIILIQTTLLQDFDKEWPQKETMIVLSTKTRVVFN